MDRDELIAEISMRRDIPIDEVEEVIEEEDMIFAEEYFAHKRKKKMITLGVLIAFIAGVVAAVIVLDRQEKISIAEIEASVKDNVKKYVDKVRNYERA